MTTDLKDELERLAERTPTYDVFTGAVALHRRRRGRRLAAVAGAVVLVALGALAVPASLSAPVDGLHAAGAPGDPGSLPRKVALPRVWTPEPGDDPAGPAALLFGGHEAPFDSDLGNANAGLVGLREDSYRVLRDPEGGISADGTLLSPDGTQVAYGFEQDAVRLRDLRTGDVRNVVSNMSTESIGTVAWSPDGRTLLLAMTDEYPGFEKAKDRRSRLGVVEIATGEYRQLPQAEFTAYGFANGPTRLIGAFSADSTKVAYQVQDRIHVASLTGEHLVSFPAGKERRLAGKGAWTRDGTALALVDRTHCCDDTPVSASTTVVELRAIGGDHAVVGRYGPVPGAKMIDVQGWAPDGSLVAVAYQADREIFSRGYEPGRWGSDIVGRMDVVALRPGAPPTVLLAAPTGVHSVDIAQTVLAGGRFRPGTDDAPVWPVQRSYLVAALVIVGVPLVLLAILGWAVVRVARRIRRRRAPRSGH